MKRKAKRVLSALLAVVMVLSMVTVGVSAKTASGTGTNSNVTSPPEDAGAFGEHYYKLYDIDSITTWEDAEAYCESLGGHLAIITSKEENDFLYQFMIDQGYTSAYFGLTDSEAEGIWIWVDGSSAQYTNWHAGEPNSESSSEDYGMFYWKYTDGTWNDGDFGRRTNSGGTAFLCEWDNNFFVIGRDSNSFWHTSSAFGYKAKVDENGEFIRDEGGHLIYDECTFYSDTSIGYSYPTAVKYFGKLCSGMTWDEEIELLDILFNGSGSGWNGSCQGLSLSLAMANMGKINVLDSSFTHLTEKQYAGSLCYYSLESPGINVNLRDLINYYYLLQYTDLMPSTKSLYSLLSPLAGGATWDNFWESFYQDVKTASDNNVPLLFGFGYRDGDNSEHNIKGTKEGHTVITCGYDDSDPNFMIVKLYDCNYSAVYNTYIYLFVSRTEKRVFFTMDPVLYEDGYHSYLEEAGTAEDGTEIRSDTPFYASTNNWSYFKYWDMSAMNSVDPGMETASNTRKSTLALQANSESANTTTFRVNAYQPFRLENSAGQYIKYDGESYSGNMQIYNFQILGEESQFAEFEIDFDDSLTITEFTNNCKFSTHIGENYYTVTANNADTIFLSKENGIQIEGTHYSFSGALSVQSSESLIYLSGECSENCSINYADDGVQAISTGKLSSIEIETISVEGKTTEDTIDGTFTSIELDSQGEIKNIEDYHSTVKFSDVNETDWFYPYVTEAAERGLMSGTGDGQFSPYGTTTRAMFVQILYAMAGKPEVTIDNPFTDVPENAWYAKAVQWAYENRVTGGTGDHTFSPNANVTREQIAVFLYAYAGKPAVSGDLSGFADASKVSSWAKKPMIWATQNKIISGSSEGGKLYLNPLKNATRAETATMMVAFAKRDWSNPHPELNAYREFLSNNSWIGSYESNYEYKKMAVFDLNQDGIYEVAVEYCGESWDNYTTGLLSYHNGLIADLVNSVDNDDMGTPIEAIDEQNGLYVLGRTRGKAIETILRLNQDGTSTVLGSYFQPYFNRNGGSNDISVEREYDALTANMYVPQWVEITSDTLNYYLSGNGKTTGLASAY